MFAITGITGNVGGEVARNLLDAKQPIRAVVRNVLKGAAWAKLGCEVALADIDDATALARAFAGAAAVFVLVPSNFDPSPGLPEARATAAALQTALSAARPGRVVYLSTIGAQCTRPNLLMQHSIVERALRELSLPITFLRPGWFMENSGWDVKPARQNGVISSFLQPLDKPVPMVATADIGRVAAELMEEAGNLTRVVELEGPHRVTPNEIAASFSRILDRAVRVEGVPRASWEERFRLQGMKNPMPRIQMLDGFNQGWIEFERGEAGSRKGKLSFDTVLKTLIEPPEKE